MKKIIDLNGKWKLFYYPVETVSVSEPKELGKEGVACVDATVPGNVELDLANAGVIPKELFKGMATEKNEIFETYEWWYEKEFQIDEVPANNRIELNFGAVDCFADYYINGEKVYSSDNAYTDINFDITNFVKVKERNILHVHIKSAVMYAFNQTYSKYQINWGLGMHCFMRKPAHCFGWDIMPRAVSAGIYKDAAIWIVDEYGFEECSYDLFSLDEKKALMSFRFVIKMPFFEFGKNNSEVRVSGVCKDSKFEKTVKVKTRSKLLRFEIEIQNPKLWWPYGYGDANVYDVTFELISDGEVKASEKMNMGIRTVELKRTDTVYEENAHFKFIINGVEIMCKGTNWVPLDAYHSRDRLRYEKALGLLTDTHCNILRVWAGGVYEDKIFYDYCDRHGIMVWQDFMLAGGRPSLEKEYIDNIRSEATWAVRKFRNHPSIILWAGDNELDSTCTADHFNPDFDKITREIFKDVVCHHDAGRPYLPSSPYISGKTFEKYNSEANNVLTENHLWGSRDYYKADYYKNALTNFISETGYHGSPSVETIKKTVDEECVWPIFNEQWTLHSSDQGGNDFRVRLMWDQIKQLFDFEPENLEDFVLASQISQAEADKFFIERMRINKPRTSGIMWWNILDGWPQMSDAVVDYFFDKKLAYYYIKRSQEPIAIMIEEMHDWVYTVVASNDTLSDAVLEYKVYDIDTSEVYAQDTIKVKANSNFKDAYIKMMYPEKRFLVIEWKRDGKIYYNHYLTGLPPFDFASYKKWLDKFNALTEGK